LPLLLLSSPMMSLGCSVDFFIGVIH
jgi:hypothetical protein